MYFENRLKQLRSRGTENYPHKFHVSMSLKEFIERYSHLTTNERIEEEVVSVAGNWIFQIQSRLIFFFAVERAEHEKENK